MAVPEMDKWTILPGVRVDKFLVLAVVFIASLVILIIIGIVIAMLVPSGGKDKEKAKLGSWWGNVANQWGF